MAKLSYIVSLYDVIENKEYILHNTNTLDLLLNNVKMSLIEKQAGSLTFEILESHPYYEKVVKHTTRIIVYDTSGYSAIDPNGNRKYIIKLVARPTKITIDIDNVKKVTCEGELNILKDILWSKDEGPFTKSTYDSINLFKTNYDVNLWDANNDTDLRSVHLDGKGFNLVINDAVSNTDSFTYNFKKGTTFYDALSKITSDDYYFNFAWAYDYNDNLKIKRNLSVSKGYNQTNQTIEFGVNLVSLTKELSDDYANAIIPTGKDGLTIETVNTQLFNQYMKYTYYDVDEIKKVKDIVCMEYNNDAITEPNVLLSQAKFILKQHQKIKTKIKVNAVDMNLIDGKTITFFLSSNYRVISIPNGIDQFMRMTRMDIDISNPKNSKYTLESEGEE